MGKLKNVFRSFCLLQPARLFGKSVRIKLNMPLIYGGRQSSIHLRGLT